MVKYLLNYQVPATQNSGWLNYQRRKVKNKGLSAFVKGTVLSYPVITNGAELNEKENRREGLQEDQSHPTSQNVISGK